MKDLLFGNVLPGPFTAKDFRLFLQPLVGLLALFLAACETPGRIKDVKVPVVGESIVFGSANIYEKGKPQKSGMTLWGNQVVYLMILPPNTNKAFNYMITGDEKFYWTLAPGDYMVLGFKIWRSSGWRTGRIRATFSVPEGAGSVYIGTLEVRVEKGRYLFEVRDSSASETRAFRERYPGIVGNPIKQLVQTEKTVGKFDYVADVCAERWGITCTKQQRGVKPIAPAGSKSFNKVDSLRPTFSWDGSSRPDLTYDLVVFEAAAYARDGLGTEYLPGRVSVYEEDINASEFQLQRALKPATKYFWSVRLREDDTVSQWSSFGYFEFYLIAWASGESQWFAFETPGG